jgi:hypothetical protein
MPNARTILNRGDAILRRQFGSTPDGEPVTLHVAGSCSKVVCVGLFDEYQTEREFRGNQTFRRLRQGSLTINRDANPQLAAVLAGLGETAVPDKWLVSMGATSYAIRETRADSVAWTLELEGINP